MTPPPTKVGWRDLSDGDRWLCLRYALAVVWAVLFVQFTPTSLSVFLSPLPVLLVWGVVAAAALAGIIGVTRHEHLTIEFPPLLGLVLGFAYYVLTQVIVSVTLGTTDRVALIVLACIAWSPYLERFEVLLRKFVDRVRGRRAAVDKARNRGRRKAGA